MPLRYTQIHGTRDLSRICRLCLKHHDSRNMVQIFANTSRLLQMEITHVLQIQLSCGDGLPACVCKLCIEKLTITRQFSENSIAKDDLLRKVQTFISEVSSLDTHIHNITEETLVIFELINGNGGMSSLCRLCATQHKFRNTMKIFVAHNSCVKQIRNVIHSELSDGDGLPDSICISCAVKLDAAHHFITESLYGDNLLRNVFYKSTEVEGALPQELLLDVVGTEQKDNTGIDLAVFNSDWSSVPNLQEEVEQQLSCGPSFIVEHLAQDSYSADLPTEDSQTQGTINSEHSQPSSKLMPTSKKKSTSKQTVSKSVCAQAFSKRRLSTRLRNRTRSTSRFACNICKDNFDLVQTHRQSHSGERPNSCRSKSATKNVLIKPVGMGIVKDYVCDLCKKQCSNKSTLVIHTRLHSGERVPYKCPDCHKTYATKRCLSRHSFVKHKHPFSCKLCSMPCWKTVTMKEFLAKHPCKPRFVSSSPHVCKICKKLLSCKRRLVSHMQLHTPKHQFPCDICYQTFSEKCKLTKHSHIHAKTELAFVCPICQRSFSRKYRLTTHLQIHAGEQPFTCLVCSKVFAYRSSLNRHAHKCHATKHT